MLYTIIFFDTLNSFKSRTIIRDQGILVSTKMEGLCGEQLESGLQNITSLCKENFKSYIDHVSETGSLEKRLRPKPLIISKKQKEKSEDLNCMTKKQLKDKIEHLQLNEKEKADWKKIMKGKKEGYVKFLKDMEKR